MDKEKVLRVLLFAVPDSAPVKTDACPLAFWLVKTNPPPWRQYYLNINMT